MDVLGEAFTVSRPNGSEEGFLIVLIDHYGTPVSATVHSMTSMQARLLRYLPRGRSYVLPYLFFIMWLSFTSRKTLHRFYITLMHVCNVHTCFGAVSDTPAGSSSNRDSHTRVWTLTPRLPGQTKVSVLNSERLNGPSFPLLFLTLPSCGSWLTRQQTTRLVKHSLFHEIRFGTKALNFLICFQRL